jgi:hypothetical protein
MRRSCIGCLHVGWPVLRRCLGQHLGMVATITAGSTGLQCLAFYVARAPVLASFGALAGLLVAVSPYACDHTLHMVPQCC